MIISRYLAKEVLVTTITVTLILLIIFLSNQFIHFLIQMADGKLAISLLMHLLLLEVPYLAGYLFPIGLFFGILLAYGRLYTDNEITVMRACGIGQWQLLRITLSFSLIIIAVVAILVLWAGPVSIASIQRTEMQQGGALMLQRIMPGSFESFSGGQQVFYVENISHDREHLNNIFVAQLQKPKTAGTHSYWIISTANTALHTINPITNQQFIVGYNGYRYSGEPGKNNFDIMQFGQYGLELLDKSGPMQLGVKAIPTANLWQAKHNNLNYEAEWLWRISMPFSVFSLVLLGVPLSRIKPRQGKFAQLLPATLLYIIYANMMFVARDWIESGLLSPKIGLWVIHIPMLLLALYLLLSENGWKPLMIQFGLRARAS